jgi:hypothetical protein
MPQEALIDGTPHEFGGSGTCGGAVSPASGKAPPPTVHNQTCPRGGLAKSGAYYRGMIAPLTKMRLTAVWWCEYQPQHEAPVS